MNDDYYSEAMVEKRLRRFRKAELALPRLPWKEALKISDLARVSGSERKSFGRYVCGIVRETWRLDSVPAKPGPALIKAAKAVQMLQEAQLEFDEADRALLSNILETKPVEFDEEFERLPRITRRLHSIFNSAMGTSKRPERGGPPRTRGRKKGSVSAHNKALQKLVHDLQVAALAAGGDLTFDKNFKRGSLIEVLNALRKHLPAGVVRKELPGTIQKFVTGFNKSR